MKTYELYDIKTGKLAFTGTANECREFVGANSVKQVYNALYRTRNFVYRGYQFVEYDDISVDKIKRTIEAWDAFVEPLREKYGIPKYKGATP